MESFDEVEMEENKEASDISQSKVFRKFRLRQLFGPNTSSPNKHE